MYSDVISRMSADRLMLRSSASRCNRDFKDRGARNFTCSSWMSLWLLLWVMSGAELGLYVHCMHGSLVAVNYQNQAGLIDQRLVPTGL